MDALTYWWKRAKEAERLLQIAQKQLKDKEE